MHGGGRAERVSASSEAAEEGGAGIREAVEGGENGTGGSDSWFTMDAQLAGDFAFVEEDGAQRGVVCVEPVESAAEEVVKCFHGGVLFRHAVDESSEIRCAENPGVRRLDAGAVVSDREFTQRVQVRASAADKREIGRVEQIEFSRERRTGAAGSPCCGAHNAMLAGQPVNDEAGVGEQGAPDEDTVGIFHRVAPMAAGCGGIKEPLRGLPVRPESPVARPGCGPRNRAHRLRRWHRR